MIKQEEWRPAPGFDGYEVSNLGRVMSYRRPKSPRVLTGSATLDGYRQVQLIRDGELIHRRVHRLVMEAFVGPCPEGEETRHLDGDRVNNELSNLAYGTRSQNSQDQVAHGTHHMARRTHCPQGHPYDAANTLIEQGTHRRCRTCRRDRDRRRRERRMFAAANVPLERAA